jgi:hypothetical protein
MSQPILRRALFVFHVLTFNPFGETMPQAAEGEGGLERDSRSSLSAETACTQGGVVGGVNNL